MDKKRLIVVIIIVCFFTTFLVLPAIAAPIKDSPKFDVVPTLTPTRIPRADSWNKIAYSKSLPASIYSIIPSCNNLSQLYAITDLGIYYSLDNGGNWIKVVSSPSLTPQPTVASGGQENTVQLLPTPEPGFSFYYSIYSTSCKESIGYLYVGTPDGILRISLNDQTFRLIARGEGLPSPANVGDIAFSYNDPSIGYISLWEKGIYKTSDWGNSWTSVTGDEFLYTDKLAISSTTPEVLYAVTSDLKLHKSTDMANYWEVAEMGGLPPGSRVFKLIVDSNTHDLIIWVNTPVNKNTNNFFNWLSSLNSPNFESIGIYRSTNNGIAWSPAFNGIDNPKLITSLIGTQYSSGPLFITTSEDGVFYRSDDFGNSWTRESPSLLSSKIIASIYVSNNEIMVGAQSGELFETEDNGKSWYSKYASVPEGLSVFQVVTSPIEKDQVYLGTSNGIYLLNDGGKTWHSLNKGITSLNIISLTINPMDPKELFAGSSSGEIFKSSNGGKKWSKVWEETEKKGIRILYFDRDLNIFAGTDNGMLLHSVDRGENWIPIDLPVRMRLHEVVQDTSNTGWLYLAADAAGLLLSKDNGMNWQVINQLGQNHFDKMFVYAVAVDALKPGRIYISLQGGKLYRSDNYAKEWTNITSKLFKNEEILKIVVEQQRVIVLTTNNIFISNDDGHNWNSIIYGFPSFVRFLTIAPGPSNTNLFFVGTETNGLFTGKIGEITGADSNVAQIYTSAANTLDWQLRTVTIIFVIASLIALYFSRSLIKFFISALLSPINILLNPSKVKVQHGLAFYIVSVFLLNAILSPSGFYYPRYTYPLVYWGYKLLPDFPIQLGYINIYSLLWLNSIVAFSFILILALEYTLSSFVATNRPKSDSFSLALAFFLIYYQIGNFIIALVFKISNPGPLPPPSFTNTITAYSWAIVILIYLLGFVFSFKYCGSIQAWGWFPIAPIYAVLQWTRPVLEFFFGLPWKLAAIKLYRGIRHPTAIVEEIRTSQLKTKDQLGFYLFVCVFVLVLSAFVGTVFRFIIRGLEPRIGILSAMSDSFALIFDLFTFVFLIEWVAQLLNQKQSIRHQKNPREIVRYEILFQALLLILPAINLMRNVVCYVFMIAVSVLRGTDSDSVNTLNTVISLTIELTYLLKFLYLYTIARYIYFPNETTPIKTINVNFKNIIIAYRELFLDLFAAKRVNYYSNDLLSFLQLNWLYFVTLFLRFIVSFAKLSILPSSINFMVWIDTYLLVIFLGFALFVYLRIYPEFSYLEIANPILIGLVSLTTFFCVMLTAQDFLSWLLGDMPYLFMTIAYLIIIGIITIFVFLTRKLPLKSSTSWSTPNHLLPAFAFMTGIPLLITFINSAWLSFSRKTKISIFLWADTIFYHLSINYLSRKVEFNIETQRLHSVEKEYLKLIATAKAVLKLIIDDIPQKEEGTIPDDSEHLRASVIRLVKDSLISGWVNLSKINLDLALREISQEMKDNLSPESSLTSSNLYETKEEVYKQAGMKALSQILALNQSLSYKNISSLFRSGIPVNLFYMIARYTPDEKVAKVVRAFADLFSYEAQG